MSQARASQIAPRGLHRETAARYIGVGITKFDAMVSEGRMPAPKLIDRRKVWDREALDMAFDALPTDEPANPWDALLHEQG